MTTLGRVSRSFSLWNVPYSYSIRGDFNIVRFTGNREAIRIYLGDVGFL